MEIKKRDVKCPHCDYEYKTKSTMVLISCSSCGIKFNIKDNLRKE